VIRNFRIFLCVVAQVCETVRLHAGVLEHQVIAGLFFDLMDCFLSIPFFVIRLIS